MPRIVYISLVILLWMGATANVWGEGAASGAESTEPSTPQTSNMRSWQNEDRQDNWTWFGMGYESRRSFTEKKGAATPGASGGGKGSGAGGPGGRR